MGTSTMESSQPTLADNSGGTPGEAFAATLGEYIIALFINLAEVTGNVDVLTTYTPGHRFKIKSVDWRQGKPVTTGSKRADLNLEIGTTNVTGGLVSITSALATPLGAGIAGSAITGNNVGSATDSISVEASNVTAHAEGNGWLLVRMQNLDTADAFATLREILKDKGEILA